MSIKQTLGHKWAALHKWVTLHPRKATAIGVISLLLLVGIYVGAVYALSQNKSAPVAVKKPSAPKKQTPPPVYYSPLTGVKVADEAATKQPVTAIMIENSPDARPHSGIKEAGIVYEAIAEGGITRFLTLFQETKPQLIGPVRSLRMYYLDWAAAYNACIAHVGGSAASLAEVRNGSYCDLDQFFNAGSYWRANDRYAPHNVYTSFEKLDALTRDKNHTSSSFTGFAHADGKPSATPNATSIALNFSSYLYNTNYAYDAATNTYLRSIAGEPSNDREAGRIAPSVVVALKVDMTKVMEDGWRESITTIGTGQATVFQSGTATDVTWRKSARNAPLELIDAAGKAFPLNRGQTWIAAIPNGSGSVSWQ